MVEARGDAQRIIEAIRKAVGRTLTCSMCGTDRWSLSSGFHPAVMANTPTQINLGGQLMPLIGLVCYQCGHTVFFNVLRLGFTAEEVSGLSLPPLPAES